MIWMRGLLVSIFVTALFLILLEARGGEMVECVERHGPGRWVYRAVDGRKCWFPAGRLRRGQEKPLEELRWPLAAPIAAPEPVVTTAPEPAPEPPQPTLESLEFEHRWQGIYFR